ncbi:hypothetical protein J5N97_017913 [Dioscorea zingiberensis]|uniref:BHLH domain-containing protein n=1 Tax=Dioscorea zingiberensis TaxID=325984 RepID=A0A9D5HGY8_9LILI|nr:hypothetical protein J5N97_017913 [Dioscorea zingiberensis]
MALETVVFPQGFFDHACKELVAIGGEWISSEFDVLVNDNWKEPYKSTEISTKRKRRQSKSFKNKEELESQRMIHIAAERNRRRLMNEYLAVLRSLMPPSYVQRGDQASIIGGAINYVKELEQLLQSLEAHKRMKQGLNACSSSHGSDEVVEMMKIADIEVKMVESHASLKVLLKKRPKQLLKIVSGLQGLKLTTFHLNITTVDQMVLYSFSLKDYIRQPSFFPLSDIKTLAYYYHRNHSHLFPSSVRHHVRRYSADQQSEISQISTSGSKRNISKWALGSILTLMFPFWTHQWKNLEGEVEIAAETVEKVATIVEKVSSGMADKLQEDGKLKHTILSVEKVSKEIAEEAHLALDIVHKMEDLKDEVDIFIDPILEPKSLMESNKGN